VDFRKAYELDPSLKDLKTMSERPQPPQTLEIVFGGSGPELLWNDQQNEVQFGIPEKDFAKVKSTVRASTENWYKRHKLRNHEAREILLKSNYMAQYMGIKTAKGAKTAGLLAAVGTVATVTVGLAVAVVGVGLYIIASAGGSGVADAAGGLFSLGFGIGAWGVKEAGKLHEEGTKNINESEKKELEELRTYRFVRFMPNVVGISLGPKTAHDGKIQKTIQGRYGKTQLNLILVP
jgi:hypothetical protein